MSELKGRFINSIEYLRKMGFFEDYSSLTSEEIYKIISGGLKPEEEHLNKSIAELDYDIACLDAKRVFKVPKTLKKEERATLHGKHDRVEEIAKEGELESLFSGLVRISRGAFQPKIMEGERQPSRLELHLEVGGKHMGVEFGCKDVDGNCVADLEKIYEIVSRINIWIKDTGYQYYSIGPKGKAYVVLSRDEAKKLEKERRWKLFHIYLDLNPTIKERLMNSMRFLRKMGFFQDYSNLSSWKILEKIFSGEIDYSINWEDRLWSRPHGAYLKDALERFEDEYLKAKIAEMDCRLALFDNKRFFVQEPEVVVEEGMGIGLIRKLARISRGTFQPTDIGEKMSEWEGKPPPELKRTYAHEEGGYCFEVSFKLKGEDQMVRIYTLADYLEMRPAIERINELIKDTGYQYYFVSTEFIDYINYIVLSREEAKRLKRRGWKFYYPSVN
jgi:hypothetical protein